MSSEYPDPAASVTLTVSASPWRDPSDCRLDFTGRSYQLKMQSTWLRSTAVSDNIQCSLHLSDAGIYLLNSFQTSRFWHLVKFPSMCPHWLNANLFRKAQLQIHETVFSVFPTVWTTWFLETFFLLPSLCINVLNCVVIVMWMVCNYVKWRSVVMGTWISTDWEKLDKTIIWYSTVSMVKVPLTDDISEFSIL